MNVILIYLKDFFSLFDQKHKKCTSFNKVKKLCDYL